ncbi:MAG TPA: thioredoxin-disulfide reductase [Clostridia bacterium]|nr:thioredoxin-disulfide reductase [Clostridia bacterium]
MVYDVLVIGGGPAGLTAGLYAARAGRKVALIEKAMPGGQAFLTNEIENYPGFPEGIGGPELMMAFQQQATRFGLEIINGEIVSVDLAGETKKLVAADGQEYLAKAVIIATGAQPKNLGVPGEEEFRGRGVSYCATCDGAFFRGKKVAVVGGGDSAVEEALFLTRFASRVVIIHRRDQLRAINVLQERARSNEKIEFRLNHVVEAILGDQKVERLRLKNVVTGEVVEEEFDGVFVFVGTQPNTKFLEGVLALDEQGRIITNETMGTSLKGVFAAGDVRNTPLRQVATAVGDGAIAAYSAEHYLANML